jgi:ArsR family transcriptional regulator, arsenate/arsenite/antimonite-responsive transcriptional repressor
MKFFMEIDLTPILPLYTFIFNNLWRKPMEQFLKVMKALSDPGRVKILKMLEQRSLCVCEMREALGLAQPTVSKHLKTLEEAGLVTFFKEGLWVNYRLTEGRNSPYAATMLGTLRHWLTDDPEIDELVSRRLPFINREIICRK